MQIYFIKAYQSFSSLLAAEQTGAEVMERLENV